MRATALPMRFVVTNPIRTGSRFVLTTYISPARLLKRRPPSIYAGNPCFAGYGNHGEADTSSPASILTQALNTFLPLALLLFRTIRPAFVFIRARNPWVCFLQWLLGWNVIFAISEHLLTASCVFTHHNMLIIAKRPSDVKRKHFTHTPFFTKKSVPQFPFLLPDKEKRKRSPVSLIFFRTTYCSEDLCKLPGRHRFSPEHRRLPAHRFLRWDRAVRFHPAANYLRHHMRQNRQLPRLQSVPRQVLFSST